MDLSFYIFPPNTTFKNDYTVKPLFKRQCYNLYYRFTEEPQKKIVREPSIPTCCETLEKFVVPAEKLPFNTTWRLKPIVQQYSASMTFSKLPKLEDTLKEEAIRTRPRMTGHGPTISMDDISKDLRQKICDNIYTTEQQRLMRQWPYALKQKKLPNTTHEENVYPVRNNYKFLEVERPKYPNKFDTIRTVKCDEVPFGKDLYWPGRKILPDVPGEYPYKSVVSEEERKEIQDLIAKDRLRIFCDKLPKHYGGHRPKFLDWRMQKIKIHDNLWV